MIAFHGADANLGTGQVLQNCDGPIESPFESPDHTDDAAMEGIIAVTEVEARHIHPVLDKLLENLFRSAGGSDRANYFCPAHLHQSTRVAGRINEERRGWKRIVELVMEYGV